MLGQSFGGMCAVTYLSFAPHGIREAFITGGLPGSHATPTRSTAHLPRVSDKNAAHFARYPDDATAPGRSPGSWLTRGRAADGGPLGAEPLQSAGAESARRGAAMRCTTWSRPFADAELSNGFLYGVMEEVKLPRRPAVRAAARAGLLPGQRHQLGGAPDPGGAPGVRPEADPLYFTGEMIYPWMFDADLLRPLRGRRTPGRRDDWPPLYDPARLAENVRPGGGRGLLRRHVRGRDCRWRPPAPSGACRPG